MLPFTKADRMSQASLGEILKIESIKFELHVEMLNGQSSRR